MRKPVDRHAFHATTKYLRQGRLIGMTEVRRFLLRKLTRKHRVFDGDNQSAFRGQVGRFGWCESDIGEHIAAALIKTDFGHAQSSASSSRARRKRISINSASGFGRPIPDFDFFMKACST